MATQEYLIRRRIEIDAAHRVPDHKSKCFNLHGHRYVIEAECRGPVIAEGEQTGMVMDFGFLKDLMIQEIHEPCDHGLILFKDDTRMLSIVIYKEDPRTRSLTGKTKPGIKLLTLPYVPTAENLAHYWFTRLNVVIKKFFDERDDVAPVSEPKLYCVRVYETPNCMAQYPAETP